MDKCTLSGRELDTAVAQALGLPLVKAWGFWVLNTYDERHMAEPARYSTDYRHGGPLMELEKIGPVWIDSEHPRWVAVPFGVDVVGEGPTALIAGMRAFVALRKWRQAREV